MKPVTRLIAALAAVVCLSAPANAAGTRVIVRVIGGPALIQSICVAVGCSVNYGLGDPSGQVFLVTTTGSVLPNTFLSTIKVQAGVLTAEIDLTGRVSDSGPSAPSALFDDAPVNYFGSPARHGYLT